jgi:Outer membrane protein beta-barrel domain
MFRYPHPCLTALACWCAPFTASAAQSLPHSSRITISPTAGYLAYGTYFTAPGGVTFSNHDGFGIGAELDIRTWRSLSVIASALHGSSDWSFESVPLVGAVSLDGASLWFVDVGLRVGFPLATGVTGFGQATAGAVRYGIDNALISDHATNFAFSGGLGVRAPIGRRVSVVGLVKDYIASFSSVDDAEVLGIEGKRAHTVALLLGVGLRF